MTTSYEQVFLALAMRNKMMSHEVAQTCLAEFRAKPESERPPIEEVAKARGGLTDEQVRQLREAARRVCSAAPTQQVAKQANAAPSNPSEPVPGYRFTGKLGVGGTATVFSAVDVRNGDRTVAVKILHPSLFKDEKARERFLRESRLLVEFDHANLVKGFDCGTHGPLAWVAMELLEGESAQEVLDRDKRIAEARALEIILEAAKAMEYMQSKGIVHRDIKPGNVMVLKDGRVKVCDLGFAQPIRDGVVEEETTSGTAQYMSPEQARGQGIDVRADIYSLGATLYHMVMGELPFAGTDSIEVMAKQVMEALNSSEIKNRRVSKHMHYFIERMMSKDKTLRYSTPRDLIDDITEQIEGFKSLDFDADQARQDSSVLKLMRKEEETREPTPPPGSRKTRRIDNITKRFRRER
ncbi:MAG: serine/threonine protein kinase [Planctomycetes bacterium]|nr:serine/threonine protein kinase [Planctomycetota bacterium]